YLLVSNASTVLHLHGGGTVTVRTGARGNKVLLCVEDDGPVVADDAGKVLEPFVLTRAGENSLELGACQGLARGLEDRRRGAARAGCRGRARRTCTRGGGGRPPPGDGAAGGFALGGLRPPPRRFRRLCRPGWAPVGRA